jgi:hypothetical protein
VQELLAVSVASPALETKGIQLEPKRMAEDDSLQPADSGFHRRSSPGASPATRLAGGRAVRRGEARGGDGLLRQATQPANWR